VKCPENEPQSQRGRNLSAPALPVNSWVASFEPVAISSPCEALFEPGVRTKSHRESRIAQLARTKTPEITAIPRYLSLTCE